MSKLLKSKFLLGVIAVAVMFVGVVAVSNTASADTCSTGTTTLRVGSKGDAVKCLQAAVGVSADGSFGPKTKAAVKVWQASVGLTADGVFGNMSRAKFTGSGSFPAGCTSASGFSITTGQACNSVNANTFAPAGCTNASGFSPVTGGACYAVSSNPQTGPVTVALANDNPASGSFIVPASGVEFAKFAFSGNGTVTSVKLQRTGVSSSSTVSNVYLYDGATRLTDGASIGSDNTVTFNALGGIFTVAGSKTISVVADTLVADYSLAFKLISYTAGGTTSTVAISGNEMYGAAATLSALTMTSATGSGNTDAGADINVWQGTASNSTRDVILKRLALRQIGSIVSADINNFKLYVDGVLVSSVASLDSNGYVTFTPNTVLKTGARVFKVTADVLGGSGRTVQFSLRGAYDLIVTDTQYNANGTTICTTGCNLANNFPFGPSAFTVNSGTLTVIKKTNSPSTNVTVGASDQNLATYTFTAYGEPVKVETLNVGMITTGGTVTAHTLRNVRILVNGSQVGSNTSVPAAASFIAASGTSFTTNFVVYPGSPATVEIHSDIFDNEGDDNFTVATVATAVQAVLIGGSTSNAVPQISLGTISVPSAANVLGNNLTVASGSMSLAKTSSYASRSIAVPTTAYKIGSFQLSGNSTEAVNLNTLYVGFADTTSDAAPDTDLSDLYVVYGNTTSPVKGTVTCVYSVGCDNANSWSINRTLAVNETMQVDVYATIASSLSTNSFISTLAIAGTTASSGIVTYADASGTTTLTAGVSGQEITGASGSVTISQDASTAVAQIVDDSGTIKSLTAKIVALTDSYTVTDMTVTVTNVSAVSTVILKDHDTGTIIGTSKPAATSITWSGLDYPVNASETKKVDVELALTSVGVNAGTSDAALTTGISAFTARNSGGTSATGTGTATGNAIYIFKALPLVSSITLSDSNLAAKAGAVIAKFTVSSNGTGNVAWKQALLEISKTATPTLASYALYNADTGTAITAAFAVQNDTVADSACDGSDTACELVVTIGTDADDDAMEQVSGAKTYEIRATVGGAIAATDSISLTLDRNSSSHTDADDYMAINNTGAANNASFVWSDESASTTGSTDAAVTTWHNDYLVKNLPVYWSLN